MDWGFLSFLAEPWFVIPWYLVGVFGAVYVAFDLYKVNTPLKQAMKWSWPIIVLFFSIIGIALYFGTARAPGIGKAEGEEEKAKAHKKYEQSTARRVNGAVIHCVAGDGLGIMTGMVIARAVDATFWQEFWFEYLVGFLFGWLIFQFRSMLMMTDSKAMALAMAFRAEFFSMLTVMSGMGAVMTYVTPSVVGAQPDPLTYAFWGFGMLGLLVGYVFTFPMNWMMVKVGWKHGMGGAKDAPTVQTSGVRYGLLATMVALGAAALALPAWLTEVREGVSIPPGTADVTVAAASGTDTLARGIDSSLRAAAQNLRQDRRENATHALDAAFRAAEVGAKAAPDSAFPALLKDIKQARHALHMGRAHAALQTIARLADRIPANLQAQVRAPDQVRRYANVPILNAQGVMIGEIIQADGGALRIALGGARDVWGFWDLRPTQVALVPEHALVFGPKRGVGKSYVVLPTFDTPPVEFAAME